MDTRNVCPDWCPKCNGVRVHFMDDGKDVLGRYECDTLFQSWKPLEQSTLCKLRVAQTQLAPFQSFMDDRPVTEEGKASLGFIDNRLPLGEGSLWVGYAGKNVQIEIENRVSYCGCKHEIDLPSVPTMGELKRLIHVLGIKVPA